MKRNAVLGMIAVSLLSLGGCKKHEDASVALAKGTPLPNIDVGAFPMRANSNVILYWSWMSELAKNWHDPKAKLPYQTVGNNLDPSCLPGRDTSTYKSMAFPLICYVSPAVNILPSGRQKDMLSLAETPLISVTHATRHGKIVEAEFVGITCDPDGKVCKSAPTRHMFVPYETWEVVKTLMDNIKGSK